MQLLPFQTTWAGPVDLRSSISALSSNVFNDPAGRMVAYPHIFRLTSAGADPVRVKTISVRAR